MRSYIELQVRLVCLQYDALYKSPRTRTIYEMIKANPSICIADLLNEYNRTYKTVYVHTQKLVRAKLINAKKQHDVLGRPMILTVIDNPLIERVTFRGDFS